MIIDSFRGQFEFLSNFSESPFQIGAYTCNTVEHWYQMSKTLIPQERAMLLSLNSPSAVKSHGKKVTLRADWDEIKDHVMAYGVLAKFQYNPTIRHLLLKTGSAELIEGNTWHDNYWGNCVCPRCKHKLGLNMLGKILMITREYFYSLSALRGTQCLR